MNNISSSSKRKTAAGSPGQEESRQAALEVLRAGGVVAFPTDTLYGLGADVFSHAGLERIFHIKGRPPSLALPVLVAGWQQVAMVAEGLTREARELAAAFWPGSLTLVLPRSPALSPLITGGRDTVAVRMPDHWAPLGLTADLGNPITGTSANRSGQPDLLTVAEVMQQLGESIDYIIGAGPAPRGLPSTVVDLSGSKPVLLRAGATSFADVLRVWKQATGADVD